MYTTAQVAHLLGVSPARVRHLIKAARLKATKVGRDWLIPESAIAAVRDRKPGRPRREDRAKEVGKLTPPGP